MKKFFGFLLISTALVSCDNSQPVGGRGYFDAPLQVQQQEPTALVPDAPVEPEPEPDMTASLADAVEAAIAQTEVKIETKPENPIPTADPDEISTDDGSLNLNAETFAEQEEKRNAAAAALAAARDQLVIIEPGTLPEVMAGVNIAQFARSTKNAVGEQLYRRPIIKNRFSSAECRKFRSPDDAQRNFLANGGPELDPLNLDPDGDGFACKWSPEHYRLLR